MADNNKFSTEERQNLGECFDAINSAQKHLSAVLNSSMLIKENEILRSIYFNLQKQKVRLNKLFEKQGSQK